MLIPHSNRTLTSRAGEGSECDLGRPTSSEGIDRKTKRTENSLSWREGGGPEGGDRHNSRQADSEAELANKEKKGDPGGKQEQE